MIPKRAGVTPSFHEKLLPFQGNWRFPWVFQRYWRTSRSGMSLRKLWNAARFAFLNLGRHTFKAVSYDELMEEDRWILSRLSRSIAGVTKQLEKYNPSAAIGTARDFFLVGLVRLVYRAD